jgi:Delta3-Delta2-enoyl-CoA isomerase
MLDVIDHPERIREIRLARPPVNALNGELLSALRTAVTAAGREADAMLVTGAPGVFSAGLDVPGLLELERAAAAAVFSELWHVQRGIATSPIPVVFGITGHCPAGGTVLAMHADYRVLAQGEFRMGLNEVQVGLFPGGVIHGAFQRLVGGHTAQLLARGALLDCATALRVGLVDELCDADRCITRALEVAREFCALPREPMLRTRELARRDLTRMFGEPAQADERAREFGAMGADWFFVPETQERLRTMFARKKAAH